MNGTILFYNLDNGSGLILAEDKKKYKFDIELWDDADHMPSIGLKVVLTLENETLKSVVAYEEKALMQSVTPPQAPRSIDDAARMILETNVHGEPEAIDTKLNVKEYSATTVPKGFIEATLERFFSSLQGTVNKYKDYHLQSPDESLDYFKMKRFLFTAYNNLLEIDSSLADGALTEMYRNIQEVNSIHDLYKKSYLYPKIAFSTIFLKYTRYKDAKRRLEANISEMANIKTNLNVMEVEIKQKVEELGKLEKEDVGYVSLQQSIKHVKRLYVDTIDRLGTLREENELLIPVTNEYFELFFEEFSQKFEHSYEENIKHLIDILGTMAFLFDRSMWEKASSSKAIDTYFKSAGITYPYSSLTYLRYYLKMLDKSKLTSENRELFELLEYLEKRGMR